MVAAGDFAGVASPRRATNVSFKKSGRVLYRTDPDFATQCRWRAVLLALALPCALPALADEEPVELAPVLVEAQRIEVRDSGVVIAVPVAPLAASNLAELLSALPGVQVRSSGGLGSYSEASLRGSSGRQVRVLLDGLPLDSGGGESQSLSLISPLLLEEVTIYKGRVPIGLGSGLAGTIDLRSRRELPQPVVASASLGSFDQRQLDVAGQLGDAQLAVGTQAADNDFRYVNEYKPYDPDDPDQTAKEPRRNAGTEQHYGLLRYRGPIELSLHAVDDHQELPTRLNSEASDASFDTESYAAVLALPADSDWNAAFSHRYTRETYRDPDSQIGLGAQETRSDTHRTLLSAGRDLERWQHSSSIEFTEYTAKDALGSVPTSSARRLGVGSGIGLLGDPDPALPRHYNAALQATWSRDESAGESDDHWQIEPAVGATQKLGADCVAAGNLGYRKRLPTFFERYGDRGLFRGNPALKPESANYADLGTRCGFGERLERFELTAFAQDLHDVISPVYSAQGVGRSINTDRGLIYGVELSGAGALAGLGWELGGTWQHTEDRSQLRATRGKQLPGRFETQVNTRIEKRWNALVVYYAWRLEAGQFYDSPNNLKAPEMQRHDLGLSGAVRKFGWSVQALNLSDDRAEQFNGYPMPGRRWMVSLSYPRSAALAPAPAAAEAADFTEYTDPRSSP